MKKQSFRIIRNLVAWRPSCYVKVWVGCQYNDRAYRYSVIDDEYDWTRYALTMHG